MTSTDTGANGAEERARIAGLLARYPQLPGDDLDRIHAWFRKGATALDLGLLASDPAVAAQYRAYRAAHYDRITPADYARAAAFLAVAVAILAVLLMR
jgi:hypothetical protein